MINKSIFINKLNKRIELKDVYNKSDIFRIEKAINLSKFSFNEIYPKRTINSIYLDNHLFNSLTDSFDGNCSRKKTRIRWYGNSMTPTPSTLEIKRKQGFISWKETSRNSHIVDPSAINWSNFITKKNKHEFFNYESENLLPKSIVSYNRRYFASFDRKIRITIDNELKFFEQVSTCKPNLKYANYRSQIMVTEIKVDLSNHHVLNDLLTDLPFTSRRFSKYSESVSLY